jgi:hypothetical protein
MRMVIRRNVDMRKNKGTPAPVNGTPVGKTIQECFPIQDIPDAGVAKDIFFA